MSLSGWKRRSARELARCRVFSIRGETWRSERSGGDHEFYVIDCPDWVNVVPVTDAGEVVMVRQHRFGIDRVTLEVPGGMLDPGESPAQAARRELLEETGYTAREVVGLGVIRPNPALQTNTTHSFLALGCREEGRPTSFGVEETEVVRVAADRIDGMLRAGEIDHALVAVAFLHWRLGGSRRA